MFVYFSFGFGFGFSIGFSGFFSGANTDELNAYRAAIRREIERHKRYPARAKMMRKQGIVNVSFSVGADGSLSGERVA